MSDDITLTCRICLEEESNMFKLINPCRCNGTSKYVHIKCINEWIETTENHEAKKQCMECKTTYNFKNNHVGQNSIYFCNRHRISDVCIKQFGLLCPLSILFFSFDFTTNTYFLIYLLFPEKPSKLIIPFFEENFFLGVNYYYYIFSYIYFCCFYISYITSIYKKVNIKGVYIKKAANINMMAIVYIIVFFWINSIVNFILQLDTIILLNLCNNLFSPYFIYFIIDEHDEILKKLNETNVLLPLNDNDSDSDIDSESHLLNIEIR